MPVSQAWVLRRTASSPSRLVCSHVSSGVVGPANRSSLEASSGRFQRPLSLSSVTHVGLGPSVSRAGSTNGVDWPHCASTQPDDNTSPHMRLGWKPCSMQVHRKVLPDLGGPGTHIVGQMAGSTPIGGRQGDIVCAVRSIELASRKPFLENIIK